MKRNILIYGGLGTLAVALVGIGIASAAMRPGGASMAMQAGPMMGFGGPGGMTMGLGIQIPAQMAADQATEFQNEATATGLSLSVITDGWSQGESLMQIAQANGIIGTQLQTDLKNFEQTQMQTELNDLVSDGTITQSQATARLAAIATQQAKIASSMGSMGGWTGGGRGFRGRKSTSTTSTSTGN